MKLILPIFILMITLSAHAELRWENVVGFSNRLQWGINNNANVTILGGMAGLDGQCDKSNVVNTCDTCTDLGVPCNNRRVYPEMEFTITIVSTDKIGTPRISVPGIGGGNDQLAQLKIPVPPTTAPNQNVVLTTTWSELCRLFQAQNASSTTCATSSTQQFKIGIDSDSNASLDTGTDDVINVTVVLENPVPSEIEDANPGNKGLYEFTLFPGDEKAYIENVKISAGSRPVAKVHFYSALGDYSAITNGDLTASVDVLNGTLLKDFIEGLPNGEERFFKTRTEDDAGNIGWLMEKGDAECPVETINGRCRAVTPSAVGGLFKDNCFIATAAYGSKFEPHVKTLRQFRDKVLMPTTLGKTFVRFYYKVSPTIADWIAASESRRAVTRWALTPVVFSARTLMAAPLLSLFTCAFGALILFALVLRRRKFQPVRSKGRQQ